MVLDLTQFGEKLRKKSFQKYQRKILPSTGGRVRARWCWVKPTAGEELQRGWCRSIWKVVGSLWLSLLWAHSRAPHGRSGVTAGQWLLPEEELDSEWEKHEQNGTHWDLCGHSRLLLLTSKMAAASFPPLKYPTYVSCGNHNSEASRKFLYPGIWTGQFQFS